jgi:signal peptidase I
MSPRWRHAVDWILTIVGAVVAVLVIKTFVVNPYRIPSSSMEPTLHCARPAVGCLARFDDRVLANRFIYRFRSPRRGEIVVFDTPPAVQTAGCGEAGSTFVKRIIGLPGDRVRIARRDGSVSVNGRRLSEPYVVPAPRGLPARSWHVPSGQYFVLGDNRPSSCDSRVWGYVPRDDLIGPVMATYWPPQRASTGLIVALVLIALAALAVYVVRRIRRPQGWRSGEPTAPPT